MTVERREAVRRAMEILREEEAVIQNAGIEAADLTELAREYASLAITDQEWAEVEEEADRRLEEQMFGREEDQGIPFWGI